MPSRRLRALRSPLIRTIVNSRFLSLIWQIRVAGLLLAALAIWLFAEIAEEVLEQESQALDTNILLAIRRIHTTDS